MFDMVDAGNFTTAYPDEKALLSIHLKSPLLQRARLIELANALPSEFVEFNPGDLPISLSPENIPQAEMSAAETIEKIGTEKSWMVLRNIEQNDAYRALTHNVIDQFGPEITAKTGPILRREGFIFISSAGAVTPFHIDEEHNILTQIEGSKTVRVFSQHDRELASQVDLERFHSGAHRNLKLDPSLDARGVDVTLTPGDALYIPPLAPHWVKVLGDTPSLSLSVTWRSNSSIRTCYLHQINHQIRQNGGKPRFPGESPLADQLKIWRFGAENRLKRLTGAA